MNVDEFLAPRILIVSGKGGVGKTTVSAALALVAARHGRTSCIAEVDRKGTLPGLFGGGDLGYEPRELSPGVWGINISPEEALAEYLRVQYHMRRISRVFTSTHFVDYITTAAPGLKDILVLGKIWYLEQGRGSARDFDLIVMDAPAAGRTQSFLAAPLGLSDAVRVGPIRRQAEWLVRMLRDPARTRVHLVTLAEEMPVSETIETARALEGHLGINAGTTFANSIYSPLLTAEEKAGLEALVEASESERLRKEAAAVGLELDAEDLDALVGYARFLQARHKIQEKHMRVLRKATEEKVVELPFLFSAGLALPDIETLADAIEEEIESL